MARLILDIKKSVEQNAAVYFEKAKKCYRIRSQIVHGDTVQGDLRKEADSLMVDLEKMTRLTLSRILLDDRLIGMFLDKKKLKNYFSALTLHENC